LIQEWADCVLFLEKGEKIFAGKAKDIVSVFEADTFLGSI